MTPQPGKKSDVLIGRLNSLYGTEAVNMLELQRIENEARTLRQADPVEGDMVLGMVYCLKGDIEAMRKAHANAVSLSNRDAAALQNYAVSLNKIMRHTEAAQYAREAYEKSGECSSLETLIYSLAALGLQGAVERYLDEVRDVYPQALDRIAQSLPVCEGHVRLEVMDSLDASLERNRATWDSLSNR